MSLQKAHKLADTVLACLALLFEDEDANGYCQTYRNGRENGYCVTMHDYFEIDSDHDHLETWKVKMDSRRTCYFCEYRGTDGIVIYCDTTGNTEGITEKSYRNTLDFQRHNASGAANAIFKWLKEGLVVERKLIEK